MTKPPEDSKCQWCRRPIDHQAASGRKRRYCRQSCRQRSYEARRQAGQLGLAEGELVVTKQALEALLDQVYVLQAAIEDVDRDLADAADDPAEVERALKWLLSAARPVANSSML